VKVYLVRHGETEGNVGNIYQTELTPLTAKGIAQAELIAKRLEGLGIRRIYSSPHLRAMKTSEILSRTLKVPFESWKDLMEIRRPKEIRGKKPNDPGVAEIEQRMLKGFTRKDLRISDEENFFDVSGRAIKVLNELAKKPKDENIICVSHGTFIKTLVSNILLTDNLTPEIFVYIRHHLWAENTGLTVIEYTGKHGWRLLTWNDTSHL